MMPILRCHVTFIFCVLMIFLLAANDVCAEEKNKKQNINSLDNNIEHLLDSAKEESNDTIFSLKLSEKLAEYYYRNNQYSNALTNYLAALDAAKSLNEKNKVNKYQYNIGLLYTKIGNFPLAINYLSTILDENTLTPLPSDFNADIYGELATAYLYIGDYMQSSEYQIKALRIRELLKDTLGIGKSQYTFGNMYYQQQNYKEAQKHYEEAFNTWQLNNFEDGIYRCYAALGSVFGKLKDSEKSLKYNLMALELAKKLHHPIGIAYALHNVGENYSESGAYSKANDYFYRALEIMIESEDKNGQTIILESIGRLQLRQNHPQEALQTLQSALQLAQELKAAPRIQELYSAIAANYDSRGNLQEAFNYKEKYIALKDSLLNESDLELINQMQINYNLEQSRKEQAITKLKQQNKLQNIYFAIGIATISLLLLTILIVYIRYQIRLKRKDLLQLAQTNIDVEKEQIKDSNEDLKQFVYVVAHDLQEPLRMIRSYTQLLHSRLKKVVSRTSEQKFTEVQDEAQKMGELLGDLLEYSRLDSHEEMMTEVDVNEMVNIASSKQHHYLVENDVVVTTDELPIVRAFPKQFAKLFELLIDNSIKFRQQNIAPKIHISCEEQADTYCIRLSDNGIGIKQENLTSIFELFKRGHTDTTYNGTGFGLGYCKKVMENHKGNIWVQSVLEEGSTFFLTIPKNKATLPQSPN
ncbi:MAG: tetratricopeptide repeat protein [Chitinophagales bacterium]